MNAPLHRRPVFRTRSKRGFTLTEILVVIGIIAVLAALLTPVAYRALSSARDSAMGMEIQKLQMAVEEYKRDNGDYPPSFGGSTADSTGGIRGLLTRHIRKCYPRIDATHLTQFLDAVEPQGMMMMTRTDIDQSEALVFWLSRTVNNPRFPFAGLASSDANAAPRKYYDFDERRLVDVDGDGFYSFKPQYAGQTAYVYIDSRTYDFHMNTSNVAARVEGTPAVRPYYSDTFDAKNSFGFKLMNPNTYQILCAGQDGDWGPLLTPVADTTNTATRQAAKGIKRFPSGRDGRGNNATDTDPYIPNDMQPGGAYVLVDEDLDNLGNFSGGRTLKANLP